MTVTPIFEYLSPCKTLAKNAVAFCPCLKNNFPGAKLKSNELISLAEEILRQSYIDSVMWLFTLMQFYNEKKSKWGKKKCKTYSLQSKKSTRKPNVGNKACVERDKRIREGPNQK